MCARWLRGLGVALLVFGGLGLSVNIAAAQIPQPPPLTGSIAGSIVARETGQAVPDATVTIERGIQQVTVSNAGGRFRFDGLTVGEVSLVVSAPGFVEQRLTGVQILARETTLIGVELESMPRFMERVLVSATKMPASVGDIAAPASIVSRAEIDRKGDQTLTQAIANTPSALVSTELGIFESVMLRGLPRTDGEFTSTLLLIDGVPQTLSNGAARVNALTLNDASSIEVIRGPNSALYGRSAIGGSVNLQTADPTPTHQYGFDFTGGQFEMAKGIIRAAGPVLDWGGYYVSLAQEREGGYFVNKATDDFAVGNKALFAKLAFSVGPKTFGSLSVNRVVADSSTPTNEPVIDGQLLHNLDPAFERFTNFNLPGRNYQQSEGRLTLNLARQFTPTVKGVAVLAYRAVRHQFVEDGDFIGGPYDLEAHTATQFPFNQQTDEDIFYEELRVELTPKLRSMKDSLILGFSHEGNKGSSTFTDISVGAAFDGWPVNYLDPVFPEESSWIKTTSDVTYKLGVTALFAQYIAEPTSRTVVTAAGRFDHMSLESTRSSVTTKDTFNAFSPKLSLTQRILGSESADGPRVNLYGAYSHAFVPPRRPSALEPEDVDLELEPENINNYEGGIKASVLDGKVALEATYFFMTEDGVVLNTREGSQLRPTNAGEQRYKGVETGVNVSVSPRVSVFANASFFHNRFGDFVIESEDGPEADEVLTGNRLPFSPDFIANFGASFIPVPSVEATVEVKRVGDLNSDRGNTFLLDAYSLVDAAVSYRRGRVRVTLSARNLFNEEYYSSGSTTSAESVDPGRPRQVLLTTSVRFR